MTELLAPGPGEVLVRETPAGPFTQEVRVGLHTWVADEPPSAGGDDAGPAPYDMLGAALGACISMTLRMYVERKGWPVESIAVLIGHEKVKVTTDDGMPVMRDRFTCTLTFTGDLSDEQRARLREIADRCPVHRTLEHGALFDTRLAGEQSSE
ncbi:OsmC family protein [Isoptericola sp. b441]|uniref:OsmC family protein n=1 Tax=Actinotalea lenta TaxID=3064654 RepID=A0ABT9D5A7_9CELL|nr:MULTISPECIES: OsmC family protein [unclassified Isoptericola]MDO8105960.1 OsmC family protein [Isoptericola sp. b441]MDO8122321.1 OsmC family protein [Isoptericola sp. b490]